MNRTRSTDYTRSTAPAVASSGDGAVLTCLFVSCAGFLTWIARADVAAGDSGEIGTASYLIGVAHPTGFPLDLLVLRLAACLPLGPIAFRQNVAVALLSAAALTAVGAIALRLYQRARLEHADGSRWSWPIAVVATAGLLAFRTFIGTALSVEVYSTALLLCALCAFCALGDARQARACWPLLGLSCAAHITGGYLMLPIVVATTLGHPPPSAAAATHTRTWSLRALGVLTTALAIAYLPLAARRDTAADWGDPESVGALLAHLTAARIRSSFSHQMFATPGEPVRLLLQQLGQVGWLIPLALLGIGWLLWRARPLALVLLASLTLDLAYCVWINPMGIADRQVGHASGALLAIAAALGVGALGELAARVVATRWIAPGLALLVVVALGWQLSWPAHADGYVVAERYGSGSAMSALPPRAAFVCTSDAACAAGMFARYVENVRPDLAIVPGQHLWDATILRRLRGLPTIAQLTPPTPVPATARRALAARVLRALVAASKLRPVWLEQIDLLPALPANTRLDVFSSPPMTAVASAVAAPPPPPSAAAQALAILEAQLHARFGSQGPSSAEAREAWAQAFGGFGKHALQVEQPAIAVTALRRALQITPSWAVGYSNLGVALETTGELPAAIAATQHAIELSPQRPTAWLNLARLELRTHGAQAGLEVLRTAAAAGIDDPRLAAFAQGLAHAPTAAAAP